MTDFQDHFEDMDEEIGEFREDLTDRLEDLFGFEVEIKQVRHEPQHERYQIQFEPVGAADILSDELEADVTPTGVWSFHIDT